MLRKVKINTCTIKEVAKSPVSTHSIWKVRCGVTEFYYEGFEPVSREDLIKNWEDARDAWNRESHNPKHSQAMKQVFALRAKKVERLLEKLKGE